MEALRQPKEKIMPRSEYHKEKTITLTMEELRSMESDNWVMPQKMKDFLQETENE